ncbi:MAG: hypothetical protein QXJ16_01580 [Desulfurococcaceae archaeon]
MKSNAGLSSVYDVLKAFDRAREVFKRTRSIAKALEAGRPYVTLHEVLRIAAEERLKEMGYRVIHRDHAPDWIKRAGNPDIIAVKNDEYVLVEVKPSSRLRRYSKVKAKLILVTYVEKGGCRGVGVKGIRSYFVGEQLNQSKCKASRAPRSLAQCSQYFLCVLCLRVH